jgi:hypothetical protein
MKKPTVVALGFALATLSGCGKKDEAPAVAHAPVHAQSCTIGQVYSTQYGCLAPFPNQQGYGNYNNQAVVASCWSGTVMTASGCQTSTAAHPTHPTNPTQPGMPNYGRWVWYMGYGWVWVNHY